LAAAVTGGATSLTVAPGTGALFPIPTAPQYFRATLVQNGNSNIFECVKVTAAATDTFTIARAQEGTTALSWNAGDFFNQFMTAADLQNFTQFDDLQAQGGNYAVDTGSLNAFSVTLTPPITAHVIGSPIRWKAASGNTGASTFNEGAGAASLILPSGSPLPSGIINTGGIYTSIWNGTAFQLDLSTLLLLPKQDIFTTTLNQTVLTLAQTPYAGVVVLTLDGARLTPGSDYSLAGKTVTLASGALAGQAAVANYSYAT